MSYWQKALMNRFGGQNRSLRYFYTASVISMDRLAFSCPSWTLHFTSCSSLPLPLPRRRTATQFHYRAALFDGRLQVCIQRTANNPRSFRELFDLAIYQRVRTVRMINGAQQWGRKIRLSL